MKVRRLKCPVPSYHLHFRLEIELTSVLALVGYTMLILCQLKDLL